MFARRASIRNPFSIPRLLLRGIILPHWLSAATLAAADGTVSVYLTVFLSIRSDCTWWLCCTVRTWQATHCTVTFHRLNNSFSNCLCNLNKKPSIHIKGTCWCMKVESAHSDAVKICSDGICEAAESLFLPTEMSPSQSAPSFPSRFHSCPTRWLSRPCAPHSFMFLYWVRIIFHHFLLELLTTDDSMWYTRGCWQELWGLQIYFVF